MLALDSPGIWSLRSMYQFYGHAQPRAVLHRGVAEQFARLYQGRALPQDLGRQLNLTQPTCLKAVPQKCVGASLSTPTQRCGSLALGCRADSDIDVKN